MLSSRVLVGISLAVWNSFAAYQVASSTAAGEMGNPKTYGYGLAFTTGLTALWIWSGILDKKSLALDPENFSGVTGSEDPEKENLEFKFTSTLEALNYARWKEIIGADIYKEGAWELIQNEEAKSKETGKPVSKNKIKNKVLALAAEDPDYIPRIEESFDELRFPRKLSINYGANRESNLDLVIPPNIKYDGVVEEAVFLTGSGKTEVTIGLSFLQETSAGTYYPFVLKIKGQGNDYTQATRSLQKNVNFVLNTEPWDASGGTPIDIDNDGIYDLVLDPRGNIKKPWWTEKRSEESWDDEVPNWAESATKNLPEIPWNLEYVPNARLSKDSWSLGSPAKSSDQDIQKLEKEIRQNIHTNQFLEVGCPICGSINQFTRKVSDNGIRYNCQDCMYTSGEHYVSLKSRGDKTLADFGMNTQCGVCGESVKAYTNSQFKRHLKSHQQEKNLGSESRKDPGSSYFKNFSAEKKSNPTSLQKTYGKKGARIRRRIKKELMEENIFGTKSGQWSARKSQELKRRYESAMNSKGLKPYASSARSSSQKDLSRWTKQDWSTASGKKSSVTGEPYFPAKAVAALKKAKLYKKARSQKRKATRLGKQRATYTPDIQAIVANYRSEENQPDIQKVLELPLEGRFE
jgi:transposase-like protein